MEIKKVFILLPIVAEIGVANPRLRLLLGERGERRRKMRGILSILSGVGLLGRAMLAFVAGTVIALVVVFVVVFYGYPSVLIGATLSWVGERLDDFGMEVIDEFQPKVTWGYRVFRR